MTCSWSPNSVSFPVKNFYNLFEEIFNLNFWSDFVKSSKIIDECYWTNACKLRGIGFVKRNLSGKNKAFVIREKAGNPVGVLLDQSHKLDPNLFYFFTVRWFSLWLDLCCLRYKQMFYSIKFRFCSVHQTTALILWLSDAIK